MPRGQSKTVKNISFNVEDEDLNPMASQASNGSDDHVLELAVAEKLMATKQKKKKDQQKQFSVAAKQHVNKELRATSEILKGTVESVEEIYQAFIINYAAEEDNIRAIWCEIMEEQRKLQKLFDQTLAKNLAIGKQCEGAHIKALGKAKEAVLETQKAIDFINPNTNI